MYESEATQFLKALRAERPHLEAEQLRGRAIWWDKRPLDPVERQQTDAARVPQRPYPYSAG